MCAKIFCKNDTGYFLSPRFERKNRSSLPRFIKSINTKHYCVNKSFMIRRKFVEPPSNFLRRLKFSYYFIYTQSIYGHSATCCFPRLNYGTNTSHSFLLEPKTIFLNETRLFSSFYKYVFAV